MNDGTRYLSPETIKTIITNVSEFEKYWKKYQGDYVVAHFNTITTEEVEDRVKSMIEKISSEFQDGDEIIHFDDFGIAPELCEREYVLIRRNGKVVKSILIRMS